MTRQRRLTRATLSAMWLVGGLLLSACSGGGKPSDLLVVTPDPKSHATAVPAAMHISCNVLPDASPGLGMTLNFGGTCAFSQAARAQCVVRVDDFYLYIDRKMAGEDRLAAYVNVEKYHGPGTYNKNSVISLQVVHGGQLYIWEQDFATVTVAPDARSVTVQPATMVAMPGTPAAGVENVGGAAGCQ